MPLRDAELTRWTEIRDWEKKRFKSLSLRLDILNTARVAYSKTSCPIQKQDSGRIVPLFPKHGNAKVQEPGEASRSQGSTVCSGKG
jgi:hypothetical protein